MLTGNVQSDFRGGPERTAWGFACLVTTMPSLLWLSLVCLCNTGVLFGNEWTLVPFITKLRAGALTFQDFWRAYGEHRLTLSRVCFALFLVFVSKSFYLLFGVFLLLPMWLPSRKSG